MEGTDESKINEKLLKVLVVEQGKAPYVTEIRNGYKELQQQVGGAFTTIEIAEGIDAVCADDVDFDSTPINRIVNGQPIFGTFLVARVNYNTGEYVSLTDADIDKYFKQFEAPLIEITDLLQEFEDVKIRQEEKASEPNFQEIGFYRMMPVGQVSLPTAKTAIQDNPIYSQIEDISKAHKVETIEAEPMQSKQMNLFDLTPKGSEEQLIEIVLLEGSVMQDGKKRIYDFAMTNPTGSAFSAFLKAEYGVGGHSVNKQGIGFENHNSTGIEFDWADENGEKHKTNITWLRAAIVIRKLIDEGRYLDLQEVNIDQDEKFNSLKNELEEVKAELIEIEKKWESGAIFSYKQSEYWQDLEDLKDELEKELAEIEQYHTPDEKDSEEKESKPQEQTAKDIPLSVEAKSGQSRHTKLNFRYSEDYNLYPNGAKTKYKNNIEAIKLLKRIENEKRLANPEEQIILARYVGWGGLANAFSDTASGWENEHQELKVLLDEKEYEDARNSTITAYYTEPELVKCIYNAFERFGFKGGRDRKILDPAMGTGNFFSVLPEAIADTPLYGVEIDSITGRIAKQLYQKANIYVQGYETTNFEDNSFDVVLGNIPFNNIKLYDKRYADEDFLVHDYFIAKSLDLVKPGGIIGFITSKGTMDKRDTAVREYIAQRADLIGAVRLPNNAFKALAGTEVTADILFFKKLDRPRKVDKYSLPDWVFTNTRKTDYININQYFHEHPDMVLGEMRHSRNMYGNEEGTACIAPEGQDLYAELDKAINKLHATFTAEADKPLEAAEEESVNEVTELDAPKGTKNYTYVVLDEKIYYCEHNKLIPQDYTGKRAERIKGLCEIRGALLNVIAVQTRDYTPDELQKAQKKLNSVYDRFVDRCGFINDKSNIAVFSDDDQFPLLRSIEDQSEDKQSWVKAPIFYKATI
ncbi:MAG TPA: DUF3846 domain-containing protein, partial [Acetivibrio sp.]|nr:DUF3846 domain-containing protein [Acetivibrio sp.]